MDAMDHLELSLAFPGLPELGALASDFATHALRLADFEGEQLERLRDAFLSSLALIEDTLAREGDPVVDVEVRAIDGHTAGIAGTEGHIADRQDVRGVRIAAVTQ